MLTLVSLSLHDLVSSLLILVAVSYDCSLNQGIVCFTWVEKISTYIGQCKQYLTTCWLSPLSPTTYLPARYLRGREWIVSRGWVDEMCKYIGFQIITLIALLSFISHNCMGGVLWVGFGRWRECEWIKKKRPLMVIWLHAKFHRMITGFELLSFHVCCWEFWFRIL